MQSRISRRIFQKGRNSGCSFSEYQLVTLKLVPTVKGLLQGMVN